jgi:hypothetical protein
MIKNLPTAEKIENDYRLQQYKNLPNWDSFFKVLAKRYDKLYSVLQTFTAKLWHIDDAEGVQLDNIGIIKGMPRLYSIRDRMYRETLKNISANAQSGTYPELKKFITNTTGDPSPIIKQEFPHGSLLIFTPNGAFTSCTRLNQATAAGILPLVGCYFQFADKETEIFAFIDDNSIWLLASEGEETQDSVFQIFFELIGDAQPQNFTFTINSYNGSTGMLDFMLYNLTGTIQWKFNSNTPNIDDQEGEFEIEDGIFEYNIQVEAVLNNKFTPVLDEVQHGISY